MNLKRLYRKVYTAYMTRRNPIKYAEKVGVNFVRGGYIYMETLHGEASLG